MVVEEAAKQRSANLFIHPSKGNLASICSRMAASPMIDSSGSIFCADEGVLYFFARFPWLACASKG